MHSASSARFRVQGRFKNPPENRGRNLGPVHRPRNLIQQQSQQFGAKIRNLKIPGLSVTPGVYTSVSHRTDTESEKIDDRKGLSRLLGKGKHRPGAAKDLHIHARWKDTPAKPPKQPKPAPLLKSRRRGAIEPPC